MTLTLYVDSYCTVADVQQRVKQREISATSKVTETDVERFITERHGEMNEALAKAAYITPVTQGVDSLTLGGSLQTNEALGIDSTTIQLKDSTGSMTGLVLSGDTIKFANGDQVYVLTSESEVGDNLISVSFDPGLRVAVTEGLGVTYTSQQNARNQLRMLNAIGASVDYLDVAFASGGVDRAAQAIANERRFNDQLKAIANGDQTLIGVKKHQKGAVQGTVRIGRRG